MAEAIRTLVDQKMVKPNDVSESLIPAIVGGPIARGLWKQKGTCASRRVSEADRKAAEAALPGGKKALIGAFRTLKDGRTVPVKPARIITTFSF
jgi:hypothetical protein